MSLAGDLLNVDFKLLHMSAENVQACSLDVLPFVRRRIVYLLSKHCTYATTLLPTDELAHVATALQQRLHSILAQVDSRLANASQVLSETQDAPNDVDTDILIMLTSSISVTETTEQSSEFSTLLRTVLLDMLTDGEPTTPSSPTHPITSTCSASTDVPTSPITDTTAPPLPPIPHLYLSALVPSLEHIFSSSWTSRSTPSQSVMRTQLLNAALHRQKAMALRPQDAQHVRPTLADAQPPAPSPPAPLPTQAPQLPPLPLAAPSPILPVQFATGVMLYQLKKMRTLPLSLAQEQQLLQRAMHRIHLPWGHARVGRRHARALLRQIAGKGRLMGAYVRADGVVVGVDSSHIDTKVPPPVATTTPSLTNHHMGAGTVVPSPTAAAAVSAPSEPVPRADDLVLARRVMRAVRAMTDATHGVLGVTQPYAKNNLVTTPGAGVSSGAASTIIANEGLAALPRPLTLPTPSSAELPFAYSSSPPPTTLAPAPAHTAYTIPAVDCAPSASSLVLAMSAEKPEVWQCLTLALALLNRDAATLACVSPTADATDAVDGAEAAATRDVSTAVALMVNAAAEMPQAPLAPTIERMLCSFAVTPHADTSATVTTPRSLALPMVAQAANTTRCYYDEDVYKDLAMGRPVPRNLAQLTARMLEASGHPHGRKPRYYAMSTLPALPLPSPTSLPGVWRCVCDPLTMAYCYLPPPLARLVGPDVAALGTVMSQFRQNIMINETGRTVTPTSKAVTPRSAAGVDVAPASDSSPSSSTSSLPSLPTSSPSPSPTSAARLAQVADTATRLYTSQLQAQTQAQAGDEASATQKPAMLPSTTCVERQGVGALVPENLTWNVLWTWRHNHLSPAPLLFSQKMNHFARSFNLTRKDFLKRNINRYAKAVGHLPTVKHFDMMPRTYILPLEEAQFRARFQERNQQFAAEFQNYLSGLHGNPGCAKLDAAGQPLNVYNMWIVKPSNSSRGRGIYLSTDCEAIILDAHASKRPRDYSNMQGLADKSKTGGASAGASLGDLATLREPTSANLSPTEANSARAAGNNVSTMVVQEYIANPLLLRSRKFDFRLYVLVTSFEPLEAYIYNEGYARYAMKPYTNAPEAMEDLFVHLTNSSVGSQFEDASKSGKDKSPTVSTGNNATNGNGSGAATVEEDLPSVNFGGLDEEDADCDRGIDNPKQLFSECCRDLRQAGVDVEKMCRSIDETIILSLLCVKNRIGSQPHCFELFGYDIMVDDNMKPWLIEVNSSPSLNLNTDIDRTLKPRLIADTLSLVSPLPLNRAYLARLLHYKLGTGSWPLPPGFRTLAKAMQAHAATTQEVKVPSESNHDKDAVVGGARGVDAKALSLAMHLHYLYNGRRPRLYGELPTNMGNFRRLAPGGPDSVWGKCHKVRQLVSKIKYVNKTSDGVTEQPKTEYQVSNIVRNALPGII